MDVTDLSFVLGNMNEKYLKEVRNVILWIIRM